MGCPEALRPRHTLTRVLEHTGYGVASLQRDSGGLSVQVADARAAAGAADAAVVRIVRIRRIAAEPGEHPAKRYELFDCVRARIDRLAIRSAAGQWEAGVASTRRLEAEARRRDQRLGDFLDDDRPLLAG